MAAGRLARRAAAGFAALALATTVSGCAAQFRDHGYVPEPSLLGEIRLGVDTRETLEQSIGRPSTSGVLEGDAWYYVRERVRHAGPLPPETVERELVAISFGGDGTVANVERFGLQDGRVVTLSRRVTETTVRDYGLLQQLLRNFGRIDVGEALADD
jgi:outer membrane protein assembly factor BamE (lipoprotein component of BamABCDE complex)